MITDYRFILHVHRFIITCPPLQKKGWILIRAAKEYSRTGVMQFCRYETAPKDSQRIYSVGLAKLPVQASPNWGYLGPENVDSFQL